MLSQAFEITKLNGVFSVRDCEGIELATAFPTYDQAVLFLRERHENPQWEFCNRDESDADTFKGI